MPTQFLLNIFIAVLWMLLKDENEAHFTTFFTGFLIGILILYLMHRFFGMQFYLKRIFAVGKLVSIFVWELILSSLLVLRQICSPKLNITPGIFTYKTALQGEGEITTLALLLTLTPGSVVMEVSPNGRKFYIHAMDIEKSKGSVLRSIENFEKVIMEVTRK
ncbi:MULTISPECIES: Na+/H+ antiporter subunit E [unclassified Rummeliibacillus]|uniref:Na+/H+ antiporter subunit E n=1 Tax=unclassified Rummeliibacillus TaxID=2622809 RepID=UPI000E66FF89|nr:MULTISPECIES: Na+/H+ antiporter subunit E [unclassified Rummeliibacillus]RIJ64035.1 Na+/H+ antiporter subunit E [Rummeliibacillus sp. POC4]RPJ95000.1 Na+/H+ antiporter subunit E [Rummeliibacillus sp. TYF005]